MPRIRLMAVLVASLLPLGCVVPVLGPTAPASTAPDEGTPLVALPQGAVPGALGSLQRSGADSVTLNVGESRPLAPLFRVGAQSGPTLVPTDGVIWISSAEDVVSVNPTSGVALAVKKGTAIVTALLSADPTVKSQITVVVGDGLGVKEVRLTPAEGKVVKGKTLKLQAEVVLGTGEIASDVTWSTSDAAIATVAQDGTVTGVAPGRVQVLATWQRDAAYKGQAPVLVAATEDDLYLPVTEPSTDVSVAPVDPEPGIWIDQISGVTSTLDYVKFFDASRGVAAGPGALLTTSDGGATWTQRPAIAALQNPVAVNFQSADAGWVVEPGTIHATTDAGATFTPLVAFEAVYGKRIASVVRKDANAAWVLTAQGAIYASTDGGVTWAEAVAAPAYRVAAFNFMNNKTYGPLTVTDGGMFYQLTHDYTVSRPQGGGYYNTTEWSIKSDIGAGWTSAPLTSRLNALVFTSRQEGWRLAGSPERSVDGGKTWLQVNHGQSARFGMQWIATNGPQAVRIGGASGSTSGYVATQDGGRTWYAKELPGISMRQLAVVDTANMWAVGEQGKIKRYMIQP